MSAATASNVENSLLESPARRIWERAIAPDEWAGIPHIVHEGEAERDAAEALVRRWRKVISARAGSAGAFENRLAALGLTGETAWRRFLPANAAPHALPPGWALLLEDALAIPEDECLEAIRLAGSPTTEETAAYELDKRPFPLFPQLVAPFLVVFLRSRVALGHAAPSLARALLRRLSRLCARTVAYEVKLARSRGNLEGASPRARYEFFCRQVIGSPSGRRRFLDAYPVLGRLLATVCVQMIETVAETLSRLDHDRAAIRSELNAGADPGGLALCLAGLSDVHCGGRSAWILCFESGLRVVYKPRSHRVDAAWSRLIQWINQTGRCLWLRAAKVIERDGYGWSEFIAPGECASGEEVGCYYQRQGTIAALVWLLCGQDFHAENFIAAGEYPVAVDLEGLLAPGVAVPLGDLHALPQSLRSLQFSLAGTLMLPYWRAGDRDQLLFHASGIGGSGSRPWPTKQPAFVGIDTDSLAVEYRYQQFSFENSVPRLAGEHAPVIRFLDRVKTGFAQCYSVIERHREELLGATGPLEPFRTIENRLVYRDTQDYANLLFWTTAPDLLTSGAAYDVALESLAGLIPVFANGNSWPEIIDEEKRSLWQRDIPIAYGCPTSTAMIFPSGRAFGPIVPLSSFDQMRQLLDDVSATDCEWQQSIIQALFELAGDGRRTQEAHGARTAGQPEQDAVLLTSARKIGDDLIRTSVRQECGVSWLTFARVAGGAARVYPVQYDPWSLAGSAGNALFLANLARATADRRYEDFARSALACAADALDRVFDGPFSSHIGISAYAGSFSLVYALAASGIQLGDDTLVAQAVALALRHNAARLTRERNPDFLSGAAGPIAVLAWLHRLSGEPALLHGASVLADVVRACAVDGGRRGWQVPAFHRPLLGMAHGSAGIVMALLRLYGETGDAWLLEAARAGLAHERAHFITEAGQWPNLQERDGRLSFMTGWCAGAPGIGLARLAVAGQLENDPAVADEITAAVAVTCSSLAGYQHHLCCGESGRIAFLRAAGHLTEARVAACRMLEEVETLGYWRLQEYSENLPIPGLTGGVAGIGLTLVSLVHPSCSEVYTLS